MGHSIKMLANRVRRQVNKLVVDTPFDWYYSVNILSTKLSVWDQFGLAVTKTATIL